MRHVSDKASMIIVFTVALVAIIGAIVVWIALRPEMRPEIFWWP